MTPQEAALELLRRRRGRASLAGYANAIEIPGKPATDDPDEWLFKPVESGLAAHHLLLLQTIERAASRRYGRFMVFMPPGSAKALALDTPIPTPTGWTTMGELRVGDEVFDENGAPCRVTGKSQIWRDRPNYIVRTDCGDEIIADQEHEWRVRLCGKPRAALKANGKGRPPLADRDDPASKFKIKETREIAKGRAKRAMVERAKALQLPPADLPIDPYLLGVWLGDGNSADLRITSSVDDQPWLRGELEQLGIKTFSTSVPTLFSVHGMRAKFMGLGLIRAAYHGILGRKHIPAAYLRGSIEQRLALLQGLVDTDGTVCKRRGCTTFCNTNLELAEGVRELVRSLGVKAGWSEGRAMLYGKDCGPVYRVSFFMAGSARMPRKAELTRDQYRTPNTYIEAELTESVDTVCIEVDSTSHLFLAGRSMTPTHNSTFASVVAPTYFMGRNPGTKIILASYGSDLARKHGRRARQIVRSSGFSSLFGTEISKDSSAANEWALTNGSEYLAAGLLAGLTGNRCHGAIVDDPTKGREQADSPTIRAKTWDAYVDDLQTRLIPGGWLGVVQTRWHEDDLSGRLLPKNYAGESGMVECRDGRMWEIINLPAECERADDPLGRKVGEMLWPEWFDASHWAPFRKQSRTWASLFQQRPRPDEGGIFKDGWCVRRWATIPREADLCVHSWDTAQKPDQLNDPSVGTMWRMGGKVPGYYLADLYRERVDYPTLRRKVMAYAERDRPAAVLIEDKSSGQSLIQELRTTTTLPVIAIEPHGSKLFRANEVSSMVESGLLIIPESAPWLVDFEGEFFGFPLTTHDDQVDSVTQFLKWVRGWARSVESYGAGMTRTLAGQMTDDDLEEAAGGWGSVGRGTDMDGFN